MVRRILRSMYAVGIDAWGPAPEVDLDEHRAIALEGARQGIVLLENDGILPLAADTTARIAVIGGYAELGVPVGTGSSAVMPPGGYAAEVHIGGPGIMGSMRNLYLLPSSPMRELGRLMPEAEIEFDPGMTPAEAALLAERSDVAIVFAIRVEGEGYDLPDLSLPWGQDAVIDAVASANPNTIVVLETGNPVAMPWREKVRAIVQAWYPGQAGGQAIAEVLTGAVNPSGRLPLSFPADLGQTPRPELPGLGTPWGTPTTIDYDEGAEVGYRWFAQQGDDAALRLRPRPGLHELRVRRARGRRGRHHHRDLHGHQHRRARRRRRAPALPDLGRRRRAHAPARLRARGAGRGGVAQRDGDGRSAAARALRQRRRPVARRRRRSPGRGGPRGRRSRPHGRGAAGRATFRELTLAGR